MIVNISCAPFFDSSARLWAARLRAARSAWSAPCLSSPWRVAVSLRACLPVGEVKRCKLTEALTFPNLLVTGTADFKPHLTSHRLCWRVFPLQCRGPEGVCQFALVSFPLSVRAGTHVPTSSTDPVRYTTLASTTQWPVRQGTQVSQGYWKSLPRSQRLPGNTACQLRSPWRPW